VAATSEVIQLVHEVTIVASGIEVDRELAGREAED
jgi:hypothetical protein